MRVAIAQINTVAGAFEATYEVMLQTAQEAAQRGADLIVFPAPTLMGPDPMALIDNANYVGEALSVLERLSSELEIDALVPFMLGSAGAIVPGWAYIHAGEVTYSNLFNRLGPIDCDEAEIGVAFTPEDLQAFSSDVLDADIICYLPALGFDADEVATTLAPAVAEGCFEDTARESEAWIVAANAAGSYEDYVYVGGSFVMAPNGALVAASPSIAEDLLIADIDPDQTEPAVAAAVQPQQYVREQMLWDGAALALRDQVMKRGLAGGLVVLDGSFASSVAAALACDALGSQKVSALLCAEGADKLSALTLARALQIKELDELSPSQVRALSSELDPEADCEALMQSLINARMATTASAHNLLVVSAADKTKLALEVTSTANAAASYAPFGDVFRSDVINLAEWRNYISPLFEPAVLERVVPVSGLGAEIDAMEPALAINTVDAALLFYFQRGSGFAELMQLGHTKEFVQTLLERLHAARAARRHAPAFPVLSGRSLDELAAPLTDAWLDRGAEISASVHSYLDGNGRGSYSERLHAACDELAEQLNNLADFSSFEPVPSKEAQKHASEMLSFLEDMSAAGRLERQDKQDGEGEEPGWIANFFSDN